ncbi:hypothetical protein RvY_14907-2 [Ramazzottius varieornatus]|nr:hypothetical protein RvY_14907-2 [Ramazzottius varieornatus]
MVVHNVHLAWGGERFEGCGELFHRECLKLVLLLPGKGKHPEYATKCFHCEKTIKVGECVPLGADVYESLYAVSLASNHLVIRHRDLQRGLQATQRECAVKDVDISHLREAAEEKEAEIMRLRRRLNFEVRGTPQYIAPATEDGSSNAELVTSDARTEMTGRHILRVRRTTWTSLFARELPAVLGISAGIRSECDLPGMDLKYMFILSCLDRLVWQTTE